MMAARSDSAGRRLCELLGADLAIPVELDREVRGLAIDSRTVQPGEVFFARRGTRVDAARFADDARARGAVAVVVTGVPAATRAPDGSVEVRVKDVDACLGRAAVLHHGRVVEALRVLGVTGTNGKTSVCHFVASALDGEVGDRGGCGIIGTLGQGRPGALRGGGLTTPDALTTHRALADLYAAGCERVAMEVSSHALDQRRLAGVRFSTAVFTNLSRDHLDYHGSMAEYARAKARLFAWPGLQSAVINRDDAHGRVLAGSLSQDVRLITYGTGPTRGLRGEHLVGRVMGLTADGLELAVDGVFGRGVVRARLAGRFNALNLLAAVGTLVAEGIELQQVLARLGAARAVPGRMEPFGGSRGRPLVVVDYAHTPDALGQALESLRDQCRGRLCCVFGCGGDRDAGKRPAMGAVAARLADALVLTDDNPRGENGDQIVDAILRGMPAGARVTVERDRAAAICLAVTAAGADDAVLVAGKGHETVQEVAGVRRPFSDAAAVRAALGEGAP